MVMIGLSPDVSRVARREGVASHPRGIRGSQIVLRGAIRCQAGRPDDAPAAASSATGSSMLALLEAWSQLSAHLQQRQQPESVINSEDYSSDGSSTDSADAAPFPPTGDSSSSDADTSQLILAALKLAVRSLSRTVAPEQQPSTSSSGSSGPAFGGNSSAGSSPAGTPTGGRALPAVQRSLALAVALAELYAAGLPLDGASIAAGIVAEAVDVSALHVNTVQAMLGPEVAALVHDVLAVRHAPERTQSYDDASSSALRGWLLSAFDVRAAAIEVAWRWLDLAGPLNEIAAPSSSSTSSSVQRPKHQQQLLAMEALTIYCPLGHALGLGVCAAGLEDAAFKVLFPSSYASTARQVLPLSAAAVSALSSCEASLTQALENDVTFMQLAGGVRLLGRAKSLYSIMRKLLRLQDPAAGSRRLGQMYDLLGLRAVVLPRQDLPAGEAEAAAVQACYRLQEVAQQLWQPLAGRTKDYIAAPKPNGYQSLHSTLLLNQPSASSSGDGGSDGKRSSSSGSSGNAVVLSYLELQVRTAAMHAAAEGGDAAHSGYKGRLERRQVRQLQQWTQQLKRRLAAPEPQTLLLTAAGSAGSSSSSNSSSGRSGRSTTSSSSSNTSFVMAPPGLSSGDMSFSSSSSSSSSDSDTGEEPLEPVTSSSSSRGSLLAQQQEQQQEQQPAAAAAAAAELFQHLDLDRDGHLSLYELTVLLQELGVASPTWQQQQQQNQQQPVLLLSMQASAAAAAAASGEGGAAGSGSSSNAAAMVAAPASMAQQLLEQLDSDGDGLVSLSEFLSFYLTSVGSSSSSRSGPDTDAGSSSSGGGGCGTGGGERQTAGGLWSSLHASSAASKAAAGPPAATAFAGSLRHSSSSSSSLLRGARAVAAVAGSNSSRGLLMNSWRCRAAAAAATEGSAPAESSSSTEGSRRALASAVPQQQQQQQQPVVAALTAVSAGAVKSTNGRGSSRAAAGGQDAANMSARPRQLQPQQDQQQQQQQQQQEQQEQQEQTFFAQLSLEELQGDLWEQQQRQEQRQQQQQLPTVLEDAAAGVAPSFVLVPVSSSSSSRNGASRWQPPLSAISVTNRLGQGLSEVQVPPFGPLLVTNASGIFRSADVSVDVTTDRKERLLLQLELVKPPGSEAAVLTARNLSRVVRGRVAAATVHVNGQPLLRPHGAAVEVSPGDVLEFGATGLGFQVLQQLAPAQQVTAAALQQYCGVYAQQKLGLQLPVQEALQKLSDAPAAPLPRQQQQQRLWGATLQPVTRTQPTAAATTASPQDEDQQQQQHQQQKQLDLAEQQEAAAAAAAAASAAAVAADALELQLRNISRLVRTEPRNAEQQLAMLAAQNPTAPGPWFLWAQLAGGSKRPWMARDLYRAAAVCQQQQMLLQGAAEAAAGVSRVLAQQQRQKDLLLGDSLPVTAAAAGAGTLASATMEEEDSNSSSSSRQLPQAGQSAPAAGAGGTVSTSSSNPSSSSSSPNAAFRLTSRLLQILRSWGKLEWDQKLFGPARRLWRLAANEAFKFPYELSAGGGGSVLHCWAAAEFARDNTLNARVIIGEALRKCPRDAAVAVLAGGIEAAAGDVNAARALFMRAYGLNKTDKQLYTVWPRMEGAAGNFERARALFQAGLSLYPNNTKILNLYACFEEDQGNVELARQLHRNALDIDSTSLTAMHNRVSWAGLELRAGNLDVCRQLLREGLDQHPDFPAALLMVARAERLSGNLVLAEAFARRAQKADAFAVAAMRELQQIYRAKGERALASNLSRHIHITESRNANKKAGKVHGSTAWEAMMTDVRSSEQRELVSAARERKVALGIIRPRPLQQGDAWQAGQQQHQQPQQQPRAQQQERQRRGHSRQQTQAVQQEPDSLAGFDFAAAVQAVQSEAATAHRMPGRRRRQVLQQQLDQPPE